MSTKLLSDQLDRSELDVILRELDTVLGAGIEGDVVEFGCYVGTCSVPMQRLLLADETRRSLHVYDSFAGLPEKSVHDNSPTGEAFKVGALSASKKDLITNFKRANLRLPIIHKGWFEKLDESELPSHIAFAFLDGDYYHSILHPLRLIWPRLTVGALVLVDDYDNEALPGVHRALDQWLTSRPATLRVEQSLAIIKP